MDVEAYDLVGDNPGPLTKNHATWIKDDGWPRACRILITLRCGFAFR